MLGLTVNLVGDDQSVVANTGGTLIHAFQEMLEHHRVWGVSREVACALPNHVHGGCDHPDVLRGDRLDDVVKDTDPRANRHSAPSAVGMKDLVAM